MTEQEARDYVKLVHAVVDGKLKKTIDLDGKLKYVKMGKVESFKAGFSNEPPMPEYDHAKYTKAMHIISPHGDNVPEPGEALMIIFGDIKAFFKRVFNFIRS